MFGDLDSHCLRFLQVKIILTLSDLFLGLRSIPTTHLQKQNKEFKFQNEFSNRRLCLSFRKGWLRQTTSWMKGMDINMKRICVLLLVTIFTLTGCSTELLSIFSLPEEMPADFSFSIVWGTFGLRSYDSDTGELTNNGATTVSRAERTVICFLPEEKMKEIYALIYELDIMRYESYPITGYNGSDPYSSLSLTARSKFINKTVKINEYGSATNERIRKYADTVYAIAEILEATDEWKSIPQDNTLYR